MSRPAIQYLYACLIGIGFWVAFNAHQLLAYLSTAYFGGDSLRPYQEMIVAGSGLLICILIFGKKYIRPAIQVFPKNWRVLAMSLAGGLALYFGLVVLRIFVRSALGMQSPIYPKESSWTWAEWIGNVMSPMLEEIVFRAVLLRKILERTGNVPFAIGLTSVLFAFIHLDPFVADFRMFQVLTTLFLGLYWGIVWYRTRSLGLCYGLHLGNNLLAWFLNFG